MQSPDQKRAIRALLRLAAQLLFVDLAGWVQVIGPADGGEVQCSQLETEHGGCRPLWLGLHQWVGVLRFADFHPPREVGVITSRTEARSLLDTADGVGQTIA